MKQKTMMAGIAAILFAAAASSALAQGAANPFGRDGIAMSQDDIALMQGAVQKVLGEYKDGGKSSWKSATSDRAGRATLLKTFKQKDMQCGEVEHVFTAGGGRRYVLPYCKTKDGQWKLAF